jgi:regulator of sigma E protease
MGFLPQFGNLAFTLVAFVVALSVIVAIHEYGHYIVGRWTGIKAEVFSVGFGPVLFSRTDRHGTRWQLAALPFGGYVKFLGDANAASVGGDAKGLPEAGRRHTMMGAPLWARAATVAAGPIANFILAILLFLALVLSEGRATNPLTVAKLAPLPPSAAGELRAGDQILAIEGRPVTVETLREMTEDLPDAPSVEYRIRRDGQEMTVAGPHPFPPLAGAVSPDSAAWDAGIRRGDVFLTVDGRPVHAFDEVREAVTASNGAPLRFEIWRDGEALDLTMVPRRTDLPLPEGGFETRWLLGVTAAPFFTPETETPGLSQPSAARYGSSGSSSPRRCPASSTSSRGDLDLQPVRPRGNRRDLGRDGRAGDRELPGLPGRAVAAVGLMNLFPIPILDGGHLVFHAYEAVARRPPSDRALRVLMAAGLSVLLTLMLFAVANDLFLCP